MSATPARGRARRRRGQQGFNLLEVMVALVVMTVAVMGAASLQTATTRTNVAARTRTRALQFMQTWFERLKMDAIAWQYNRTSPTVPALFTGQADGEWFIPASAQLGGIGEASADFWGNDTETVADMRYCVNLRGTLLDAGRALRADVRVWWYREGGDGVITTADGPISTKRDLVVGCGTAATAPVNDPRVHVVQASTILSAVKQ